MTLQDALVAYKTYAGAEGKSPKTVAWVVSSVGYFAEFLGPDQQDIGTITGNDLRRFIIALQGKPKFANHPYNKPQQAKLSSQSIETYCRAIRAFFGFLKREGFIANNVMAKVKMPKVPEIVIPTFSEKEIAKLLAQTNKGTNEGFRDYCLLLTLIDTGIRLSELANLTNLKGLVLGGNQISDLSTLSNLTNLKGLVLGGNQISDLSPLVENSGLGAGDLVDFSGNPLSTTSLNDYIPQLEERGVEVKK